MTTIERRPLPPPNSTATPITEADRAEIMARASEVIDHYLNGPGSYFDSGTRKPLAGDLGPNTVDDLTRFRDGVIASKQFADDPNSILDSVVDLVDRTIKKVKDVAENSQVKDDNIQRFPQEDTFDSIQTPKSPLDIQKESVKSALPISWSQAPQPQPDPAQDAADNGPTRFLVGRTSDPLQGSSFVPRPAPSQPSPDGLLSLNDAYLEYLKRLNVA
jgi:hypothetical protein